MKKFLPLIIVAILGIGLGFYIGISYGKTNTTQQANLFTRGQGGNFVGRVNNSVVSGEVINKDNSGIVVKMRDGSSKNIFVSTSTNIMKSTNGSVEDLLVGEQVMITGSTGSDGSVVAESVQIRPSINKN